MFFLLNITNSEKMKNYKVSGYIKLDKIFELNLSAKNKPQALKFTKWLYDLNKIRLKIGLTTDHPTIIAEDK
jgi:hypothetical protein